MVDHDAHSFSLTATEKLFDIPEIFTEGGFGLPLRSRIFCNQHVGVAEPDTSVYKWRTLLTTDFRITSRQVAAECGAACKGGAMASARRFLVVIAMLLVANT